jgi:tellurite resistance protein TerC
MQIASWIIFNLVVILLLTFDLGVFHRRAHAVEFKEALGWSAVWITLALLFNLGVYVVRGPDTALQFLTGYLIEEALSVDNLFVFLMIFSYFQVSPLYQHRVLFWGILGAMVMRVLFIICGVALIHMFHWVIYIFGGFLVVTGIKMAFAKEAEVHPEKNPVLKLLRRFFPITDHYAEGKFFTRVNGRLALTPLLVVLVVIETTDVIFAMDSIPAILAITTDPFIVYTSNICAILGLRSLYFALAGVMQLFHYLHYGLAFILSFVGVKMLLSTTYKIPVTVALGVVALTLLISVVISVLFPKKPTQ